MNMQHFLSRTRIGHCGLKSQPGTVILCSKMRPCSELVSLCFSPHAIVRFLLYGLRPAPAMPEFYSGLRGEGRKRLPDPSFMRPIWTVLGSCWRIDSRNALPSGQRGRITVPAKHFSPKLCSCLARALQKCPLNVYVGPSWGYVGPSVGSMLGPCSPILGVC